jgi:predicted HicB family RNase H-like nuclease
MMSNYALRIPDSLFEYAKRCAEEESVSMNQFFVMAIGRRYRPSRRRNSFKSTRSPRT